MESIRKHFADIITAGIMILLFLATLGMAGQAAATPVLKHTTREVKFFQDTEVNKWFVVYAGQSNMLDEGFDNIKVHWQGRLMGQPLILISGQQGTKCEMAFRLLWMKKEGDSELVRDFPACVGQNIQVHAGYPLTRVNIDGQDTLIDFERNMEKDMEKNMEKLMQEVYDKAHAEAKNHPR